MDSSATARAKCLHCGFPLPPNHVGRCPNCGKVGKAVSITINEVIRVADSIKKSASDFFSESGFAKPDWWKEYEKHYETKIPEMLKDVLMEHEKEREKKEKQLGRRMIRFSKWLVAIVVSVIIGIILQSILKL